MLAELAYTQAYMHNAFCITILLTVLGLVKYIKVSKKLSLVVLTLERASGQLAALMVVVGVSITASALAITYVYGERMFKFRTFGTALRTLIFALFDGQTDFSQDIISHNPYIGIPIISFYLVLISYFTLTIAIAIMDAAYNDVRIDTFGDNGEHSKDKLYEEMQRQLAVIRKKARVRLVQRMRGKLQTGVSSSKRRSFARGRRSDAGKRYSQSLRASKIEGLKEIGLKSKSRRSLNDIENLAREAHSGPTETAMAENIGEAILRMQNGSHHDVLATDMRDLDAHATGAARDRSVSASPQEDLNLHSTPWLNV